jgi:hypothetical protein
MFSYKKCRIFQGAFILFILAVAQIYGELTFPGKRKPNDYYISGDSFRAFCDFSYDEIASLDPSLVKNGDVVFVKTDYLKRFFEQIHPKITCKYIIISHNSADSIPGDHKSFLDDDKIIAWFGQNVDGYQHKKLHSIPLGIANRCWAHGNVDLIKKISDENREKIHFLYLNLNRRTFPSERSYVCSYFKGNNLCFNPQRKPYEGYLIDVASSTFIISPRGRGLDTHRLWESLYMGSIPIVKTSSLDPLYEDLPVLIINNWNEVTEEFLLEKYKEISNKKCSLDKLDINYWYKLIASYKTDL